MRAGLLVGLVSPEKKIPMLRPNPVVPKEKRKLIGTLGGTFVLVTLPDFFREKILEAKGNDDAQNPNTDSD